MNWTLIPQAYAIEDETGGLPYGGDSNSIDLGNTLRLGIGSSSVKNQYNDLGDIVNVFSANILIIGGIIFFITLIYAGFQFIWNGAKGKDDAKQIIQTALIGLVVMFVAYWLTTIFGLVTGIERIFGN